MASGQRPVRGILSWYPGTFQLPLPDASCTYSPLYHTMLFPLEHFANNWQPLATVANRWQPLAIVEKYNVLRVVAGLNAAGWEKNRISDITSTQSPPSHTKQQPYPHSFGQGCC